MSAFFSGLFSGFLFSVLPLVGMTAVSALLQARQRRRQREVAAIRARREQARYQAMYRDPLADDLISGKWN